MHYWITIRRLIKSRRREEGLRGKTMLRAPKYITEPSSQAKFAYNL
jgi:hypothetical protein